VRALWIIAACAPVAVATAGPCKYHHDWSLAPDLLTPGGATIDRFGGVVVAAVSTLDKTRGSDDPTQQDWWFSDGHAHAVVARTVIAPGLTVHRPKLEANDLALVYPTDQRTMLEVHFRDVKKATQLAAPHVKAVTYADHDLGIMVRAETSVELVESGPAHAVALVIYVGDKARSWVQMTDASTLELAVFVDDDCTMRIPGTSATKTGELATLAWLDDTGHLSARSATIKVRAR
jgi:hypothetical protein